MRVLIDIAHPAHLHYFKNFTKIFQWNGHKVLFTIRDKGIILNLAKEFELNFIIRSRNEKNKLIYTLWSLYNIYKVARKFKPDIFMDMGTIFSAPISKLMGKPHIVFEDTESAHKARFLFMPLIDVVLTPDIFMKYLGKKQIRFNSFMELLYLNKNYFKKDNNIRDQLGINAFDKIIILRFVSWEAHHDKGLYGLTNENKRLAIKEFSKYGKVIISSESNLPEDLQQYKYDLSPVLMHNLLSEASLYFGEGATMATESIILGTPAIYINPNWLGNNIEAEKRGLLFNFKVDPESQLNAIKKGVEILEDKDSKLSFSLKSEQYMGTKIDLTSFLVWFIESWPESFKIMKKNPEYQQRFK